MAPLVGRRDPWQLTHYLGDLQRSEKLESHGPPRTIKGAGSIKVIIKKIFDEQQTVKSLTAKQQPGRGATIGLDQDKSVEGEGQGDTSSVGHLAPSY